MIDPELRDRIQHLSREEQLKVFEFINGQPTLDMGLLETYSFFVSLDHNHTGAYCEDDKGYFWIDMEWEWEETTHIRGPWE